MNYVTSDIAAILNAAIVGDSNILLHGISIDSRSVIVNEPTLFVALKTNKNDGHRFIKSLYTEKKIRAFLVSQKPDDWETMSDACFIQTNDTLIALQTIAKYHRLQYHFPVLAITGSNGKTIVKEWLFELLHVDKEIVRSPKSYNSQIGVPLSILNMSDKHELAIIEAGISKVGEMTVLSSIIHPDYGIYTNLGDSHQENFDSLYQKALEKSKLFLTVKYLIYCSDYPEVHKALSNVLNKNIKLINWSTSDKDASVFVLSKKVQGNVTIITLNCNGELHTFSIPFIDAASIENAIHCWVFLKYFDGDMLKFIPRFENIHSVAMRLELKNGRNNCTIINDTYNSDFNSLKIALQFMLQQVQHENRIVILSDMLQSGKPHEIIYKEIAELVIHQNISLFVGIGPNMMKFKHCFPKKSLFFISTEDFLADASHRLFSNAVVLVKGSRNFKFESIVDLLEQKSHRTILEVNLTSLIQNLNYYRSLIKPQTKVMAMVKAFSYGSGSVEIASELQYHKVDYLAVAFADEGVHLRQKGVSMPIAVMNPEEGAYNLLIEYQLEPEIYNLNTLSLLLHALKTSKVYHFPIHIKLDTGMHRLGFQEEEIDLLIQILSETDHIKIISVFSHLAASDEARHDEFTKSQISLFEKMSKKILNSFNYPIMRHILNSAGIERFSNAQFDMVRLGIGLYGVGTELSSTLLLPVSSLKTSILQVKRIMRGETIGYSRNAIAVEDTNIAILPIGYADGFNRKNGNGTGKVFINGNFAPVIGNVCMDMTIISIQNIDAKEGDTVEIFGTGYPVTELANSIGTIPYEILTAVSPRVKRIYYKD